MWNRKNKKLQFLFKAKKRGIRAITHCKVQYHIVPTHHQKEK